MSEKAVLLANRLGDILLKLNTGSVITVKNLATEFGVSERTIQKDLNERLDPNLIESLGNGQYRLIQGYLGNLTPSDIKEFSELSGIIDLYPDIDDVIRHTIRNSLLVNSTINKGCLPSANDFKEINYTIINFKKLKYSYNDKDLVVEPYKLLNHNGIWYLMAQIEGQIKSYCVHKMKKVRRDIHSFKVDNRLLDEITINPSPWFRDDKVEVVLNIKPSFVSYFMDRNIIPNILSSVTNFDKSINIKIIVNTVEEIKGIIKFWLPNIDVVEPKSLKDSILNDIKEFIK